MLQPTALIVGIYKEFLGFGLLNLNPVWSLILVNAGFNLALAVWILNAYIGSIPVELEQAAMVDGSTRLGALFRVTLPLAMPGVVTALITIPVFILFALIEGRVVGGLTAGSVK